MKAARGGGGGRDGGGVRMSVAAAAGGGSVDASINDAGKDVEWAFAACRAGAYICSLLSST